MILCVCERVYSGLCDEVAKHFIKYRVSSGTNQENITDNPVTMKKNGLTSYESFQSINRVHSKTTLLWLIVMASGLIYFGFFSE